MRFIHMADLHLDAPFNLLNSKNDFGERRRLEQREALKKIINHIKENNIEYLFIAGDLYENEYIRKTTIEYVNNLFKEIPETKIYISPGNHDPYLMNSMYKNFKWNNNVKIFTNEVEIVENEGVDIYGFGFNDFYCKNSDIENIQIKNKEKINILITHGALEGGSLKDMEYNPLNKNRLKQLGFDYIALGHIHRLSYNEEQNQNIVYPGSTLSLGFDELGKHGVIQGEITTNGLKLEFIQIDKKEFVEENLDVTDLPSIEELIEKINEIQIDEDKFYKIILIGKRNFEINVYNIYKYILSDNIIKIKDKTEIGVDIDKISKEISLRGLFLKEVLDGVLNGNIDSDSAGKVIELGLENLN